jgi:outer membrane protein TolC
MIQRLATVLVAAVLLQQAAAQSTADPTATRSESPSPRDRVHDVVLASWRGPELESALAGLDADAASARVAAHPGAPYTELQREGISQFFSEAQNASWYLRLGAPFNAPWYHGVISDSVKATDRSVTARRRVAALETARRAVIAWLELAAAQSRLLVRETQLSRLGKALELQRKRLELGEVAGAEVTQLELERVRLVGEVSAMRSDQVGAAAELERRAGSEAPAPLAEDMQRLLEDLPRIDRAAYTLDGALDSSPVVVASVLETERIRLDGERDRRTVWGRPEGEISWEHIPTVDGSDGYDAFGFRLRVPLPFGGVGKRQTAEATARHRQARSEQEQVRRDLVARINTELGRALAADDLLAGLAPIESELGSVERSISERYRLGAVTYLEYIDGLARLDEVRMQAVDARLAALRARLELAVLSGDTAFFPLPDPDQEMIP